MQIQLKDFVNLYPPAKRYLIGVSGGRDSMALLNLLVSHGYARMAVCHFNHKLRGRQSDADERFVKTQAISMNLEFVSQSSNVRRISHESGLSIEESARNSRHAFFQEVARTRRCPRLILAHHADDQAETVLWNMLRGSGLRGLAGIRPESQHGRLTILRPLLGITRREIDAYVAANRIPFRDDKTNSVPICTRNVIRHQILAYARRKLGRNIHAGLLRTAQLATEDMNWLASLCEPFRAVERDRLPVAEINTLPIAQQRWILNDWLKGRQVPHISFDVVERVRSLLTPGGPAKINLPGARYARRTGGQLWIEPSTPRLEQPPPEARSPKGRRPRPS